MCSKTDLPTVLAVGPVGCKTRGFFARAAEVKRCASSCNPWVWGGLCWVWLAAAVGPSRRGPGAPHTAGPAPKVRTFVQRLSSVLGVTFSLHCLKQRRKGGQQALSVSLVVRKRPTNRDAAEKSSVPAESNMPSFGAVGSAPPPALHNNNRGGEGAARQALKVSSVVKPNPSFVFVRVNDGGSRKRRGRT